MKLLSYHHLQVDNMKQENRYVRQMVLPQVGNKGQDKIQNARVLVVGCGGLGCAALPYLATAGIGTIGLVDGDTVSETNLHRQILYTQQNVGSLKVTCAAEKLKALNPDIEIKIFQEYLTVENAVEIIENFDIVIDATDRIPARYLINDACVLTGKPFVHAALYRFQSQISVFNYKNGPTYRCLYPTSPTSTQSCDTAGILGTTVAIAGGLQANEVLKIILETGEVLSGQLLVNDFLNNQQSIFKFSRNEQLNITPDFFKKEHSISIKSYPSEIAENSVLLDVRSATEMPKIELLQVLQIPLNQIEDSLETLPKDKKIYIFCKSGTRSKEAYFILQKAGITNAHCLKETAQQLYEMTQ